MNEPKDCSNFKIISSFTRLVYAASANEGGLVAFEKRSQYGRICKKVGNVIRKISGKNCRFAAFGTGIGYAGKESMGFVSGHCRMGVVIYKSDGMAKPAFLLGELL